MPESKSFLNDFKQLPFAPKWNYVCTDELLPEDHIRLENFRIALQSQRNSYKGTAPPENILDWIEQKQRTVPAFKKRIPIGYHLERDWQALPTTSREDLATNLVSFIPSDAPLGRVMLYETSGTTGHVLTIPKHPFAVGCYQILTDVTLAQHGLFIPPKPNELYNVLLGSQTFTVMYVAHMSTWNHALHAKINLHETAWQDSTHLYQFFQTQNPPVITGDPYSFARLLELDVDFYPQVLLSTAVAMSDGLRNALQKRYNCPVIEWYASNETGAIAYDCPLGNGKHILPHDIFVEILDKEGKAMPPNQPGEIVVTGGRNDYLSLLRYRTGDFGALDFDSCACGDPMPKLVEFMGRKYAPFYDSKNRLVNTVDIARVLRPLPLVQHQCHQTKNKACTLTIRIFGREESPIVAKVQEAMHTLFGDIPLLVKIDQTLGQQGKVIPYTSEFEI